jgi:putative membrane-bound dehydrogenase-like protein
MNVLMNTASVVGLLLRSGLSLWRHISLQARPARRASPTSIHLIAMAAICLTTRAAAPQALFDGRTLNNWEGNTAVWRVDDGAITAEIKQDAPLAKHEYLYWKGGEVADFDLTLEYRLTGASANSGVMFRAQRQPDGQATGYQGDIDQGKTYLGRIYDLGGRETFVERGTRVSISPDGRKWTEDFPTSYNYASLSKSEGEWNNYRVVANGPHLETWVNGVRVAVFEDHETGKTHYAGVLALQLHSGSGPVKIQFRNIQLTQIGRTAPPPKLTAAAVAAAEKSIGIARKNGDPPLRRAADVANDARARESAVLWHLRPNPAKPTAVANPAGQKVVSSMLLTSGFQAELIAAEPDIHQPIAMAFDDRGRIWIAEAFSYPNKQPEGKGKDRIIILEDKDGNGSFETKKTFAQNLNLVSGLEVGFGGVWVGAAPHLLFIPDKNRDDVPDGPAQVLLDGWGFQDTHETLNSFTWGPDGWLYGCHGVFTHSFVGKPGTPQDQRQKIRAGVFRYHPVRHEFEVFAAGGSNQWGLDFNEVGHLFMTHCRSHWGGGGTTYVIRNGHYWNQANNDYAPFISNRGPDFAPELKNYLMASARYDSGEGGAGKPGTTAVYGGHSHVGTMIYLGDNWPANYRDHLFTHNLHGHQMNHQVNARMGAAYETFHGGYDMMFAPDPTYLPVDLQYGPDGAVYSIDWSDIQHCHNPRDEIWDRTNGRLYRMSWAATYKPKKIDLGAMSDIQLAGLHDHQNEWFVRTARRLLQERAAAGKLSGVALEALRAQAASPNVVMLLRALWTLHVTNNLEPARLTAALAHPSDIVRAWAIQLATDQPQSPKIAAAELAKLAASDSSPAVRLALASAAPALPLNDRWPIVAALAMHGEDAGDRFLPKMVWFATAPLVAADLPRALDLAAKTPIASLRDSITWFVARTAAGRDQIAARMAALPNGAAEHALRVFAFALESEAGLKTPADWAQVAQRFAASKDAALGGALDQLAVLFGDKSAIEKTRARLADASTPLPDRRRALDLLKRAGDRESTTLFVKLLDDRALRSAVIPLLANAADTAAAAAAAAGLIQRLTTFNEADRTAALGVLTGKPALALALLKAVEAGKVEKKNLTALHARQLRNLRNEEVTKQLDRVWGRANESSADLKATITKFRQIYRDAPLWSYEADAGRKVYERVCAACHTMSGAGGKLGPDLTGSWRNGVDYFIENIVDPNAVVGDAFQLHLLTKRDGSVVAGMIEKETDTAVMVRTVTETVNVPKTDIKERQKTPQSLMPPGLLEALPERETIELLKFLTAEPR